MSDKKLGRVVGLLFLLLVFFGATSLNLRGLRTAMFDSQDFYLEIAENAFTMRISVLLDIMASVVILTIAILIYPLMQRFNGRLALWYIGLYLTFFVLIFISDIPRLTLITLSQSLATNPEPGDWRTFAFDHWDNYLQAHFFTLIISSVAAALFYYFLFKTKMIPRVLAVWGMIAVSIVFFGTWVQIFGIDVNFAVYTQNGVFILVLILWLIAKGFRSSEMLKHGQNS